MSRGRSPRVVVVPHKDGAPVYYRESGPLPHRVSVDQLGMARRSVPEWLVGEGRTLALESLADDLAWSKHIVLVDVHLADRDQNLTNLGRFLRWLSAVGSVTTLHLVTEYRPPAGGSASADAERLRSEDKLAALIRTEAPQLARARVRWHRRDTVNDLAHPRLLLAYKNLEAPRPLAAWTLDRGARDFLAGDESKARTTKWSLVEPVETHRVLRRLEQSEGHTGWRELHRA